MQVPLSLAQLLIMAGAIPVALLVTHLILVMKNNHDYFNGKKKPNRVRVPSEKEKQYVEFISNPKVVDHILSLKGNGLGC